MERKLIRQGRNACTVTLPARWLRAKGVEAGDCVRILEEEHSLRIEVGGTAVHRSIHIDVRGMENNLLCHVLNAKYVQGYDEIVILHDNPALVQNVASGLIGMLIEQHSSTLSIVKSIVAVPEENLGAVIRRAGHLLAHHATNLGLLARGKLDYTAFCAGEHLLDMTILYCLRYLSKYVRIEQQYREFLLCATIEEAGDLIKTIGKHIGTDVERAKRIETMLTHYTTLLFENDLAGLYRELRAARRQIGQKSFLDGLEYALAEVLYNYLGYLVSNGRDA